jgi:U3 small nucleolar RNA-associated protein 15
MPQVTIGNSTVREYKPAHALQTKRPTVTSLTLEFYDATASSEGGITSSTSIDTSEARYWSQKFGLGKRGGRFDHAKRKYAHPRSLTLEPSHGGSSAIVHQVIFGPPSSLESSSSANPNTKATSTSPLAVVSGPRVGLYGTSAMSPFTRALSRHSSEAATTVFGTMTTTETDKVSPDRNIQTGGHLALCGAFRNDGRLLAVGTDVGDVRVCDVTMRATLATFAPPTTTRGSGLSVRVVQWFRNGQFILSGGDDGLARVWDLGGASATGTTKSKPLVTLAGHGDAIRCGVLWQSTGGAKGSDKNMTDWKQLAMTGSYDHTIRVWNVQNIAQAGHVEGEDRCLAVLSHGAPVEALCLMKSEDAHVPVWLLSAGGTTIKVWNPVTGQCVSTTVTQHRKTITSLVAVPRAFPLEHNHRERSLSWRILTASLDGLLQFHSWNGSTGGATGKGADSFLQHLYSTKLQEAVTSVVMDEDGDRIAIGLLNGQVLVKMRGPSIEQQKRKREPDAGTYSFFQRGMNAKPKEEDYKVSTRGKKRKQRNFDIAIRQFRYADALDDALASRRPNDVIGVVEELGKRRALTTALSNRDEERLEPIVAFAIRYISKPHFTSQIVGLANKLIDIYQSVVGESEVVDELFRKLKVQIRNECRTQQILLRVVGQLDAVMASSEL